MLLQAAMKFAGSGWLPIVVLSMGALAASHVSALGDTPVATVNNEAITETEFFHRLQRVHGSDFLVPTQPPAMRTENAGYIVLNSLINEVLILQLAAKNNVSPTDEEVNADLEPALKREDVAKGIAEKVITREDVAHDIKVQIARYNLATNRDKATDAEVEKFYNDHIDRYKQPERWSLAGIKTSDISAAIKAVNDLRAGKSFEETAKAYSDDERSKNQGGQIGAFDATDKGLPAELRTEVGKLKVGEFTQQPVTVLFDKGNGEAKVPTYWVIKLVAKTEAATHSLVEVKHQVERLAVLQKVGGLEAGDKKLADFRKTAEVKILIPGYDGLQSTPGK